MKHFLRLPKAMILLLVGLTILSCSNDDDGGPTPSNQLTITQNASNDTELTILVQALQRTNLDATLDGTGTFTVFAPTNQAFTDLLADLGASSINEVEVNTLTNILLNHVISGEIRASDLTSEEAGYVNTLSETGPGDTSLSLYFNTDGGVVLNGGSDNSGATVSSADIEASNGVIHKVNGVILLPNVVNHALANPEFSILVSALTRASFGTTYTDLLSGTASSPFTVFAPTNQAFNNLFTFLGVSSIDEIDDNTLQTVLNYHVIAGKNITAGAINNEASEETFEGSSISFTKEGSAVSIIDGSDMETNVVESDVQGTNGIVHAIDKVLLPESIWDAVNPTIAGFVAMNSDFSLLLEAVQRANLVAALDSDDNDYTVFAPGNAAFNAFLQANSFANIQEVPVETLTQVLLNHVISGTALSGDLSTSYENTLATNADGDNLSIYINTETGVVLNGGAANGGTTVADADNQVRNGVIHVVENVINLPTVVTFAKADANFSSLVAALTRDDQPDFVATLSGSTDAPFTVFAPDNDAFQTLLDSNSEWNTLADIDGTLLTAVLQHHVIANANIRAEDLSDELVSPATLQGNTLLFNSAGSSFVITDGNGNNNISIDNVNVQAVNGVIHVIGSVLIPNLP
ncbi:fasciclin domain-containing protein [Ascidiimonas aurantiaca]|uniref:fasciclin domain-containing protein n=1 Tax=Ascidiimonas aurantiaca TaxID=1685432 RepID=UPI0030EECAD8